MQFEVPSLSLSILLYFIFLLNTIIFVIAYIILKWAILPRCRTFTRDRVIYFYSTFKTTCNRYEYYLHHWYPKLACKANNKQPPLAFQVRFSPLSSPKRNSPVPLCLKGTFTWLACISVRPTMSLLHLLEGPWLQGWRPGPSRIPQHKAGHWSPHMPSGLNP